MENDGVLPPPPPPEETQLDETIHEGISKEVAAVEVYRNLKKIKLGSLYGIGGVLFTLAAIVVFTLFFNFTLGIYGGATMVVVFAVVHFMYLRGSVLEMRRLEDTYKINPRTGLVNK